MADQAGQISSHLYTKLFHVVLEGRDQLQQEHQDQGQGLSESRVDKWFNLITPTPTQPRRRPPFGVEVVLILPDIKSHQSLVLRPGCTPLPAGTTEVLLERWTLNHSVAEARDDLLTIYKNAIPLFRAVWSLLRVLPSWAARAKWRRINARVQVRVVESEDSAPVWVAEHRAHAFTPVPHPRGTISLTAEYLAEPTFSLEDHERLLSSRIRNEEAEEINDFMPTIRASSSSRPTSVISSSPAGRASVLSASPTLGSSPACRPHPHAFESDTLSGQLSGVDLGGFNVTALLEASRDALASLPKELVTNAVECLQNEIDSPNLNPDHRRLHIRCLRQLVSLHGIVPKSLIRSVTMEFTRFSGGGFSDVHLGELEGRRVVVKVLRIFSNTNNREQILWECRKEAVLWRQLHHENILHFLGIGDLPGGTIGLISPLMQNGDVMSFLRKHPEFDRLQCVIDIAEGLKFLHSQDPPIVHADIRGANILVKDDLHCCLADFGLSVFVESTFSQDLSGTASIKGAWRWLPPEALNTDSGKYLPSRDVYSFGCTIIEIFSGNVPYSKLNENQVVGQVVMGRSPPIPINVSGPEGLWNNLVPRCLLFNPLERPEISNATEYLHRLLSE